MIPATSIRRGLHLAALVALVAAPSGCGQGHAGASSTPPPESTAQGERVAMPPNADPAVDPAEGKSFATPPPTDDPIQNPPPPDDPALAARVREKFGEGCRLERICGDMAGVDCNSAADGPYYYVRKADLSTITTCGGACMGGGCTECPPKGWTCGTY
ncbi:MAG: hypothetical protein R3B09_18150 [Nannocystaceae bacterium]